MRKRIEDVIKNKVFSKIDILNLAEQLFNIYKLGKSPGRKLVITVKCIGGEKYEIENENMQLCHNAQNLLDTKKIVNINMSYWDYKRDRHIEIDITQGDQNWANTVRVDGQDEAWLNDCYARIQDILKSVKPQSVVFARLRNLIEHLIAINLGWLFWTIFVLLLLSSGYKSQSTEAKDPFSLVLGHLLETYPVIRVVFIILVFWATGGFLSIWWWNKIESWVLSLWPSVEFDFGPDHFRRQKNARKTIGTVASLFVIPLLLQLIFHIFRK